MEYLKHCQNKEACQTGRPEQPPGLQRLSGEARFNKAGVIGNVQWELGANFESLH